MITLYNGDCLIEMDKIPDGSVDMILTDLPYGTTSCSWDEIIPFEPLWEQYNRIIKDNGAIVLFSSQPFTTKLIASNINNFKHSWVWNKVSAGNILVAKYQPMKTTEDISVFTRKGETSNYYPIYSRGHKDRSQEVTEAKNTGLYGNTEISQFKAGNNKPPDARYPKHLIEFSNANRNGVVHPTQKPVELLEYLIKTYTNKGETVLDSTMGSGSTGVACKRTDRRFIGIELDKEYFKIAKDRISKPVHIQQGLDI